MSHCRALLLTDSDGAVLDLNVFQNSTVILLQCVLTGKVHLQRISLLSGSLYHFITQNMT